MSSDDKIAVEGEVIEIFPGGNYKVKLDDLDLEVICKLKGKMKQRRISIIPGDLVDVELSPYDMTKGTITYRQTKKKKQQEQLDQQYPSQFKAAA